MENLDSHEKPTLPNYLTRGASGRMLPHGLLVVARRQTVCGSTIPAWLPSWLVSWCVCCSIEWTGECCVDRRQPPELLGWKDDMPAQVLAVPGLGAAAIARLSLTVH
jgi:hypothetical protein